MSIEVSRALSRRVDCTLDRNTVTATIAAEICHKVRDSSTGQMVLEQPDPKQPDGTY